MKVGDKVPVHIGPHEVAQAEVKEINGAEAVLIVPARRVVMGIRTELTDLPNTEPTVDHQVLGIQGPEGSAPVGETPAIDNSASTDVTSPAVDPSAPTPPAPQPGVADAVAPVEAPATIETPVEPTPQPQNTPVEGS